MKNKLIALGIGAATSVATYKLLENRYHKSAYINLRDGIENLIKWTPVIWKDRDWDYIYLLMLIQFKLEQMSKLHRNEGIAVESEKLANQMEYVAKLLEEAVYSEDDIFDEREIENINKAFDYIKKNIRGWWD